jgi:hypothetical protein
MSFISHAVSAAKLPLQYVSVEIMPLHGGKLSVAVDATYLDETDLQLIGSEVVHAQAGTLDEALALIRQNAAILNGAAEVR